MARSQALVIDDNRLNGEILGTLLEKSGLEALQVISPRDLDHIWSQVTNLKVIFLDLEMPNYNGFEIHQQLRGEPALNEVAIIAYSVHTSEVDEVRRAGFDGFLGKPLDPDAFPANLERILNGKPVWEIG